jgi:hypothetical protein
MRRSRRTLNFHGAAACSEELATPGSRRCTIPIAKARNGKKFHRHAITISEEGTAASATCVVNLGERACTVPVRRPRRRADCSPS